MSTQHTQPYPRSWELEPTSNGPHCRTWFYVSRWVSRTRVEFLTGIDGKPACFRTKTEAGAAIAKAIRGAAPQA